MARRLLDYYRQFEALTPEENSQRLRARREEERAKQLASIPPLDLSRPDWHEGPDPEIVNAATFALRRAVNRYPDPDAVAARTAIAGRRDVAVEQVVLGHGAGQLLQGALRALAAGGEVVVAWPSWGLLPALAARAGARPVPVPLGVGGAPDPAALGAAVGGATRAIVLCSPNDPTGALVDRGALRDLVAGLPDGVVAIVDEALVEFAGESASCAPLVAELPNLLVLRSFSKAWGMAGFRVGYLLGHPDAGLLSELAPGQGVASPAQAAVVAALEGSGRTIEARRHAAAAERDRLAAGLRGTPFAPPPGSACHYVWLPAGELGAARLAHELAEQRIAVASGGGWADDDHVRVTVRDRRATERLLRALRGIGQ